MIRFLLDRPRFAGVISAVITIAGLLSMATLPVGQYPDIAPPEIVVEAFFPGANAETVRDTVGAVIEEEVNGVEGMIYMSGTSANDGTYALVVTFEIGFDADKAQVLVQNRVNKAMTQLPDDVRRQGLFVEKMSNNIVLAATLYSDNPDYDGLYLNNYASLNIKAALQRVPGVGKADILGEQRYSIRVWLDPVKMSTREVTVKDVVAAIQDQNLVASAGQIGAFPSPETQQFQLVVESKGQLVSPEEFDNVIIRSSQGGAAVYLRDIARTEIGAQTYLAMGKLGTNPATVLAIYQQPGSNALQVADGVKETLEELSRSFPDGVAYSLPYDTTDFVKASLFEVYETLIIAVLLVVLVTYVFLQDWRSTLIPTITIPVSLIGTFAAMQVFGFSINTLTLFGLVLAIGIVVDAAIIVLENVERILEENEGMDIRDATVEGMRQTMPPLIASAAVLLAVFIPVSFLPGLVGQLFQQFGIVLSVSVVISTFVAITLAPPLCVIFLRAHKPQPIWILRKFNAGFERLTNGYVGAVAGLVRRLGVSGILFVALLAITGYLAIAVPKGFIPVEDNAAFFAEVQLPDAASLTRTEAFIDKVTTEIQSVEGVREVIAVAGFSLLDGAALSNSGMLIVALDTWEKRTEPHLHQDAIMAEVEDRVGRFQEGIVLTFAPPAIPGLGMATGFEYVMQDNLARSPQVLSDGMDQLLAAANARPEIAGAFATFRADVPRLFLDIDRPLVKTYGVNLQDLFMTLQAQLGGLYVNNTSILGRNTQVNIQADAQYRDTVEDIDTFFVRSDAGQLLPLSSLVSSRTKLGPQTLTRFNLRNSVIVMGAPSPESSSADAIAAMIDVSENDMPDGFGYEWTGATYQQLAAGSLAIFGFALAIVFAYLFLVAQFESMSIPIAILLTVPTALLGSFLATLVTGGDVNLYTQIGLVLMIGMAARNTILIVEAAMINRVEQGMAAVEAAIAASRQRFRPLMMTGFAFLLGVFPLVIASGAGEAGRKALGLAVFGGMLTALAVGALIAPPIYVMVQKLRKSRKQAA